MTNSLGEILRKKREGLHMEVSEVGSHLRIKADDISAIEGDRVSEISSHVYVPGLIRSYAKFLRIDPQVVEEQIRLLHLKSNVENKKHTLVNIGEDDHLSPNKNFYFNSLAIAVFLTVILFLIYNYCEDKSGLITNQDIISQLSNIFGDGR